MKVINFIKPRTTFSMAVLAIIILVFVTIFPRCNVSAAEVIVNTRSELYNAAQNSSITDVKLGKDITTNNSITWNITDTDRILDLNGHTVSGVSEAVNAIFSFDFKGPSASSGTVYSRTLTIKNGTIIQKDGANQTSQSTLYFNPSGRMNIKVYLKDVNITSSTHDINGILNFSRPLNSSYRRQIEIDGGNFDGIHLLAITEPSSSDKIKLKRLTLKHSRAGSSTTSILSSSSPVFSMDKIIDSSATVYKDSTKVTNLSSSNLSHQGTIYIKAPAPSFSVWVDDWTYGEPPNQPAIEGDIDSVNIAYLYQKVGTSDWDGTMPNNAGEYTVKAALSPTDQYEGGEATADFKINKADAELAFADSLITQQVGAQNFINEITQNNSDGELSFTSDKEDIVSINSETGSMTALSLGEATITAILAEGTNHKATSVSFLVRVIKDDEAKETTNDTENNKNVNNVITSEANSPDTGKYTATTSLTYATIGVVLTTFVFTAVAYIVSHKK